MDISELNVYQQLAGRTAKRADEDMDEMDEMRYANFCMGLIGEAGEVANYLKKYIFHGHKLERGILCEELGDCLWYIAALATTAEITLSDVAKMNITKLQARYPEGFSENASINRGGEAIETKACALCLGCPHNHDKVACELAGITYFDAQEGRL